MQKSKAYPTILDSIKLILILLTAFGFSDLIIAIVENFYNISLYSNPYADIFICVVIEGFAIFYGYKKINLSYRDIFIFRKMSSLLLIPIAISIIGLGIITSEFNNIIQIYFYTKMFFEKLQQIYCNYCIFITICNYASPYRSSI
ncbi:hypothetical protein CLOBY_03490 [Clostridium saccharobutylicum]|uniref:hypothetical protein n=1 Tax=Clostridium saccharobutylicum TaxID=169679 RepID=UPI000983E9B0|nr:hypothetical protein [Clostridium saccharobutylicum]AQS08277.1 hypothetical protein CLOBY_03490 [Clostridium saccharobutylicum]MBC2435836.1 hypothetical protein [Clostridium saccharobutylicum]NSB88359.1 Na+/serine symporter [Clostridium saccharobutylicum]NYC29396.1 Na+/serine symporter [Clostridium saccharobutylicum]OOM10925.1 hypothetical protein CLSAB_43080 [Clostridium saccharobutylicum]